jgi:hypothetical protein
MVKTKSKCNAARLSERSQRRAARELQQLNVQDGQRFGLSPQIAALVKPSLGSVRVLSPDLEGASGVSRTQGEKKGMALAALDHFEKTKKEERGYLC